MAKESRCPYCLDDLVGKERVVRCVSCRTPHHMVCFDEHGGCVAFGCGGLGKADAGQSIMIQRPRLELGARWREVPLVPLRGTFVRYRPAKRVASEEPAEGPIGPWVRIVLEQEKLYVNQDVKARLVVAVTRETVVRRLEVRIFDEALDPTAFDEPEPRLLTARILGRAPLVSGSIMRSVLGLAAPYPRLRPGMHPYQVEIPRLYGTLVPRGETRLVQIGVVLERVGAQTIASPRVTVELTHAVRGPDPVVARSNAVGDPAH
ncbi:MAG: RING finger protein, partial [Planctomycetota bacterium]